LLNEAINQSAWSLANVSRLYSCSVKPLRWAALKSQSRITVTTYSSV